MRKIIVSLLLGVILVSVTPTSSAKLRSRVCRGERVHKCCKVDRKEQPVKKASAENSNEGSAEDPEAGGERLISAIASGSIIAVRKVLDSGVSPNAEYDIYGTGTPRAEMSALVYSIWSDNYSAAKLLVERGATIDVESLLVAVYSKDKRYFHLLLARGVDLNMEAPTDGMTVLECVAREGHVETIELLIKHGADVHHTNKLGTNCLEIAAYQGNEQAAKTLRSYGATTNYPLHVACGLGDVAEVKRLLAAGVSVNQSHGEEKRTPLHYTAHTAHLSDANPGNQEIASLLIEKGANLEAEDSDGYTSLLLASHSNDLTMLRLLVKHGANVNAVAKGRTAMDSVGIVCSKYLRSVGAKKASELGIPDAAE